MTHTNDICQLRRPSGARRPGPGPMATRRTRMRVSSDAVVSAYIRDVARPRTAGELHEPHPAISSTSLAHGPLASVHNRSTR
jgi:hypothetical protein